MRTTRTLRIAIEDLPALETLSQEEMTRIVGAGRFRPMLEVLEDRMLLSASAMSNLPIPETHTAPIVNFTLSANMDLTETIGKTSQNLGSAADCRLFQGHDAAGHDVVYLSGNGHLYEFTPNSGFGSFTPIGIPNNNQIIQDKGLDLFFQQAGGLYEATGVPSAGSTGAREIAANVKAVYQAKDSTGEPAAYALEAGKLYQVSGSGQQQVAGLTSVTKAVVNGQGQLYALQGTVLYTVSGTTAKQAATGVTQMALDPAGEVVVLQGPHAYQYFGTVSTQNGISLGGGSAGVSTTGTVQYALDGQGRLYQPSGGVLSVSTSMNSGFQQVATGVTQMQVVSAGGIGTLEPGGLIALESNGSVLAINGASSTLVG